VCKQLSKGGDERAQVARKDGMVTTRARVFVKWLRRILLANGGSRGWCYSEVGVSGNEVFNWTIFWYADAVIYSTQLEAN